MALPQCLPIYAFIRLVQFPFPFLFFLLNYFCTKSTLLRPLYFEFDNKQISEVEYKVWQAVDEI